MEMSATTPIAELFARRPSVYERSEAAMDRCEQARSPLGSPEDIAATVAYGELWALDDKIMSEPVTCLRDLAIKAKVVQAHHFEGDGYYDDQVAQLLADIERLAAH